VHHHTHPEPGADVRRAGGEIAKLLVEGVVHAAFQNIIQPRDLPPGGIQIEAAVHHLHAEMIFLVDHQAVGFLPVDRSGAGTVAFGQFVADELSLDEELPIERRQLVDVQIGHAGELG